MPSKAKMGWGIVAVVLVAVSVFLGVTYPIPPAPEETLSRGIGRPVQFKAISADSLVLAGTSQPLPTPTSWPTATPHTGAFTNVLNVAPTPPATATPLVLVNNTGTSNSLSIRQNATPVFVVSASGAVSGQVLKYDTSGQKIVCGSTTITGTGTLPTGLATPSYVQLTLAQDVTGDCARLSYTNASATVTAKCWSAAATPAAAATAAAVNWCAIGTP